jgi:hypothetical protein
MTHYLFSYVSNRPTISIKHYYCNAKQMLLIKLGKCIYACELHVCPALW